MLFDVDQSPISMHSTRLLGSPVNSSSFQRHRYSQDSRSIPAKIRLTIPTPVSSWASLPTPPMSGTPPPEASSIPSQIAGRRRKREDTPPSTLPEFIQAPNQQSPLIEQTAQRHGESSSSSATRIFEQPHMPFPTMAPWDPTVPFSMGSGSATATSAYSMVSSALPPRPVAQPSPRTTRKVKAHVASACINCKRKHLRCDEARPCRRCQQSGKEDTCRDVEHKKRGRPPLKNDDGTSRGLGSTLSLPPLTSAPGRMTQNYVPLLPTPTPYRMPYAASYAQPTVARSSTIAHPQFIPSQRPISFPSNRQQYEMPHSSYPPPPPQFGYVPPPTSYGGYGSDYPNTLFQRRTVPSQPLPPPPPQNYGAPYQLPPILPAPPGTTTDPAIAQQQRHLQPQQQIQPQYSPYQMPSMPQMPQMSRMPPHMSQMSQMPQMPQMHNLHHEGPASDTDEPDPKRPKMDIRDVVNPRE